MSAGACAQNVAAPIPEERAAPSKKRAPPPPPPSVKLKGVRYKAVTDGMARGLGQNGGWLAAADRASGQEIWRLKVYAPPVDPGKEADVQDIYIARLKLVDHASALMVTDERGSRYRVDLKTLVVTRP